MRVGGALRHVQTGTVPQIKVSLALFIAVPPPGPLHGSVIPQAVVSPAAFQLVSVVTLTWGYSGFMRFWDQASNPLGLEPHPKHTQFSRKQPKLIKEDVF